MLTRLPVPRARLSVSLLDLPCIAGPSVTAGTSHNCASKPSSGTVACWGVYRKVPSQVDLVPAQFAATSWSVVNAGDDFSCEQAGRLGNLNFGFLEQDFDID